EQLREVVAARVVGEVQLRRLVEAALRVAVPRRALERDLLLQEPLLEVAARVEDSLLLARAVDQVADLRVVGDAVADAEDADSAVVRERLGVLADRVARLDAVLAVVVPDRRVVVPDRFDLDLPAADVDRLEALDDLRLA